MRELDALSQTPSLSDVEGTSYNEGGFTSCVLVLTRNGACRGSTYFFQLGTFLALDFLWALLRCILFPLLAMLLDDAGQTEGTTKRQNVRVQDAPEGSQPP